MSNMYHDQELNVSNLVMLNLKPSQFGTYLCITQEFAYEAATAGHDDVNMIDPHSTSNLWRSNGQLQPRHRNLPLSWRMLERISESHLRFPNRYEFEHGALSWTMTQQLKHLSREVSTVTTKPFWM